MLKSIQLKKNRVRAKRKARVRGKISGTVNTRVSILKSINIYAQPRIDTKKGFYF